jgi:hypothetical protein
MEKTMTKKHTKFEDQILKLLSYYHKNYDVFGDKIKRVKGKKNDQQ